MLYRQLEAKCHVKGKDYVFFKEALDELKKQGIVAENRRGLYLTSSVGAYSAQVARINKTFGFLLITNHPKNKIYILDYINKKNTL